MKTQNLAPAHFYGYHKSMSRNETVPAVIISIKPLGENNSSICILSRDGIQYATMYGGPKSRLRSLAAQWNSGNAYLYKNEENHSVKLSDFDVKNYHLSFRESLLKTYAASLAAELAVKTKCAGSPEKCFTLISGFIDGLELCATDTQTNTGIIRFIWRYLELLGIQPDISVCAGCGTDLLTGNFTGIGVSYDSGENGFICSDCGAHIDSAPFAERPFFLKTQAVRYLAGVTSLPPAQSRSIPADEESIWQMKKLVYYLAEQAAGIKLKTLETGTGIL